MPFTLGMIKDSYNYVETHWFDLGSLFHSVKMNRITVNVLIVIVTALIFM